MREIGGYIELDKYKNRMLHEGAIALNCGRNALEYLIRCKGIKKIAIPKFLCDSVASICEKENIDIRFYSINRNLKPKNVDIKEDEWLYLVNYYGQIDNQFIALCVKKYKRVIVDNAQAYFQLPIEGVDTLYTCRKFFGVADGAFLYSDRILEENIMVDESYERMRFLLGRFERTATEFYEEYVANNRIFSKEPIKQMSKLTNNLLHAIDYDDIKKIRENNFSVLHKYFEQINLLSLKIPDGAFMYPLYLKNGSEIRKKLQNKKIYIPTLWPDVFEYCGQDELEYDMANNILPLPVDQRYNEQDMLYMINEIEKYLIMD